MALGCCLGFAPMAVSRIIRPDWVVVGVVHNSEAVLLRARGGDIYKLDLLAEGPVEELTSPGRRGRYMVAGGDTLVATLQMGRFFTPSLSDAVLYFAKGESNGQASLRSMDGAEFKTLSRDGAWMIVMRASGPVLVNARTQKETGLGLLEGKPTRPALLNFGVSPDGTAVAATDNTGLHIWQDRGGQRSWTLLKTGFLWGPEFSADGRWLAASGLNRVMLFDLASGLTHELELEAELAPMMRGYDHYQFQFHGPSQIVLFKEEALSVWDLVEGQEPAHVVEIPEAGINCLLEAGDGLVAGSQNGWPDVVVVWEVGGSAWTKIGSYEAGGKPPWSILPHRCLEHPAFDLDPRTGRLALAGFPMRVIDLRTGKETDLAEASRAVAVRFLAQKDLLLTVGYRGTVRIHSLEAQTVVREIHLPTKEWIPTVTALLLIAFPALAYWFGRREWPTRSETVGGALLLAVSAVWAEILFVVIWHSLPLPWPYHWNWGYFWLLNEALFAFAWLITAIGVWRFRSVIKAALGHSPLAALIAVSATLAATLELALGITD